MIWELSYVYQLRTGNRYWTVYFVFKPNQSYLTKIYLLLKIFVASPKKMELALTKEFDKFNLDSVITIIQINKCTMCC